MLYFIRMGDLKKAKVNSIPLKIQNFGKKNSCYIKLYIV